MGIAFTGLADEVKAQVNTRVQGNRATRYAFCQPYPIATSKKKKKIARVTVLLYRYGYLVIVFQVITTGGACNKDSFARK